MCLLLCIFCSHLQSCGGRHHNPAERLREFGLQPGGWSQLLQGQQSRLRAEHRAPGPGGGGRAAAAGGRDLAHQWSVTDGDVAGAGGAGHQAEHGQRVADHQPQGHHAIVLPQHMYIYTYTHVYARMQHMCVCGNQLQHTLNLVHMYRMLLGGWQELHHRITVLSVTILVSHSPLQTLAFYNYIPCFSLTQITLTHYRRNDSPLFFNSLHLALTHVPYNPLTVLPSHHSKSLPSSHMYIHTSFRYVASYGNYKKKKKTIFWHQYIPS